MNIYIVMAFKQKITQVVIPAQAGIQIGNVFSLATKSVRSQCFTKSQLRIKAKLRSLMFDWIPACVGMTKVGYLCECNMTNMKVVA